MATTDAAVITIYSDIACPWASLATARLHRTRQRLGLVEAVRFDHRAFPLELVNNRPTPKLALDAEIAVTGSHDPVLGWQVWQPRDATYPVSSLLAMEAVQAAKAPEVGGPRASEQLDLALRQAFYADSRCISLHSVVVDVAAGCPDVDVTALADALENGTARATVFAQWREGDRVGVDGSPHVFLADGTGVHNPGITMEWTGGHGTGFPRVTGDDRAVYEQLLRRAAESAAA